MAKTIIKGEELRNLLEKEKLVIGSSRTMRALKQGKIKRLILASNVADKDRFEILRLAEIAKIPVVKLPHTNQELGPICRKKHSISVIGELL